MARYPRIVAACLALILLPEAASNGQDVTVKPAAPSSDAVADLLRPPGSDPYRPPVDWSLVPPWRQTSFFDVRAQGTFFIFVVDCSGSMADFDRLVRAKAELRRAISKLRFPQRYLVIFYNDRPLPMPGGLPESARPDARRKTSKWLGLIAPEGDTDPRGAMRMALSLRPSAVYLLSDGEFPDGSAEAIAEANAKGRVPVHCIDLSGGAGGEDLKRIAEDSGGQYASRP